MGVKTEDRRRKTDDGGPTTEDRRRKTDDRRPTTEDRRPQTADRRPTAEDGGLPEEEISITMNRDLMPEGGRRVNLVGRLMAWFDRNELYMRAYPPPEAGLNEKDLFA